MNRGSRFLPILLLAVAGVLAWFLFDLLSGVEDDTLDSGVRQSPGTEVNSRSPAPRRVGPGSGKPVGDRSSELSATREGIRLPSGENDPFGVALSAVSGSVVDQNGNPVDGAEVSLNIDFSDFAQVTITGDTVESAATGEDGLFFFDKVGTFERYVLLVRHGELCNTAVGPLELTPGVTQVVRVKLRGGNALFGRVTDQNDNPLEDVRISVYSMSASNAQNAIERSTTSDADGRWRVEGVSAGNKELIASREGFASGSYRSLWVDGREAKKPHDFKLEPGSVISGRVIAEGDKPVAGAIVKASLVRTSEDQGVPTRFLEPVVTDAGGGFVVTGLPIARTFLLYARADGYRDVARVNAQSGATNVELRLKRAIMVRGSVIDADNGQPVRAFSLVTSPVEKLLVKTRRNTQRFFTEDGSFSYTLNRGQAVKSTFLFALVPGYAGGMARVDFSNSPLGRPIELVENVVIRVRRGASIAGQVVDGNGNGIGGCTVQAIPQRSKEAVTDPMQRIFAKNFRGAAVEGGSDDEGKYAVTGLLPGIYVVRVEHPDFVSFQDRDFLQVGESGVVSHRTVILKPGGRVTGLVRDENHEPQEGARVALAPQDIFDGERYVRVTGMAGTFDFGHVKPGDYWLEVVNRRGMSTLSLFNPGATNRHSKLAIRVEEGGLVRQDL